MEKKIEIKHNEKDYSKIEIAFLSDEIEDRQFFLRFPGLGNIKIELIPNTALLQPSFGETLTPSKHTTNSIDVKFNLNLGFLDLVKEWLQWSAAQQVLEFLGDTEREYPEHDHKELLEKLTECTKQLSKLKSTVESMKGYYSYE